MDNTRKYLIVTTTKNVVFSIKALHISTRLSFLTVHILRNPVIFTQCLGDRRLT